MVTWEQIASLPEYQQASPEKQAKVKEMYLGMVREKTGRAKDVMGGKVVTEASQASQQQATQEQAVSGKARAQMTAMRQRGVKVPEEEALRTPVYDPVDLAVDAATGFMGSAGKAALKAGGKALMKNVAREVGTGAVAGAGMALADKAGAGAVGQLAAGLGGGVVGGAALTGSRRLIASLIKQGLPESQAARIVGDMAPEVVEKAVKALEPTPGKIGKQTPVKRIGTAQAADSARLADDVTLHPEAEDYADTMADYTPTQGRQGIPPVDAQGRRLQAVTERYRYQQAPVEGPFGVEDTLKPVDRVEAVAKTKPSEVDPFLDQTGGFVPEEGMDVGRRIPIPEGVRHLPEGVTRGEDGKLYITIAPAKRTVKAVPEVAQAVPEALPTRPVAERPVTFEQWAAANGIPKETLASEFEEANLIGQTVFPQQRTGREAGKMKGLAKKVENTRRLKAQYAEEIPEAVSERPLDMGRGDDQAYARVQEKRALRKAVRNGEAIPPEIAEKYPNLAPKVEAPAGIGPSIPKAAMSDPGNLGIVSDAYLGKVPKPISRFFGGILEYRYGQPEAYKEIAEGALNTTGHVATEARKMVDSAKALARKTKTTDADVLGYLRGYNKNINPELAPELDNIRTAIDKWGDEAVKEGLLSPDKRKTDYLARIYERHLVDAYEPTLEARQGAIDYLISTKNATNEEEAEIIIQNILEGNGMKLVNGPSIPAKLDMGRFMERQDIPHPIRKLLGEVTNPYHLAYRSIQDVARDVTQVKMFKQIAENPLWASKSPKPGFTKINTATLPKGLSHALDVMKDKWGDVGGLYIKNEIADDLKKTYSVANEYAQMYGVLQGTWKMMKVPMNPATVTTNIISNSILCHLGGLPLWRQAVALPDAMMNVIRSRKGNVDPIYKALEDSHLFTGNYTENELGILYEGFSLAMNRTKNNGLRVAYALQWAVKKAGGQKAADFYGAVEDTYKYMLAKDLMRRGRGVTVQDMVKGHLGRTKLTPAEAVKETELWLFNYRHLPEPLKALRRTVVPFISWPYFSGKAMGRAVLNYPHRVLPILALGYAIDDKMKDEGKDIKLSKYLPYFDTMSEDWQTLGGIPVPPNLQPGGIGVSAFEGLLGRSLHGGRDIFSSDDPDEVKAQKQREYFWNTYTPPLAGYSGKRLADAVTGQPKNRYGDVEDVGSAMAGSLAGVQIRPDDRVTHYREIKRLMGKIEQEKNYLKWYLKQGYSEADKRERIELARQRIAEFTEQRDEAVKAYQTARK